MKKKHGGDHGGGGHGGTWLLSYADMVTLLLALFIILYAMSQLDLAKLRDVTQSMSAAFNPSVKTGDGNGSKGGLVDVLTKIGVVDPLAAGGAGGGGGGQRGFISSAEDSLQAIAAQIQEVAQEQGLTAELSAEVTSRGVVAVLSEGGGTANSGMTQFASGSSALQPDFQALLRRIAPVLKATGNKIEVQGHTDSRPITTPTYPSNWELSAARAGSVVRYLTRVCGLPSRQLICVGLADTAPLDHGNTPAAWGRNRRIEIVVTRQPVQVYDTMTRADAASKRSDDVGQTLQPNLAPDLEAEVGLGGGHH